MKYWYFKFTYENETTQQGMEFERVVKSTKEHFPLTEAKNIADDAIQKTSEINLQTDLSNDDFSVMIDNQVQINEEDFNAFEEEYKK